MSHVGPGAHDWKPGILDADSAGVEEAIGMKNAATATAANSRTRLIASPYFRLGEDPGRDCYRFGCPRRQRDFLKFGAVLKHPSVAYRNYLSNMTRGAYGYRIVDLDDRRTWPRNFARFVSDLSEEDDFGDSFLPDEVEDAAVELLQGHLVRAYHCTRLTKREILSIREDGLLLLSREFAMSRLANARTDGLLTLAQEDWLRSINVADDPNRRGRIFLSTDRASLTVASSVGHYLSAWGGEGINMNIESRSAEFRFLESIGTPTVVVAAVNLSDHGSRLSPGLALAALRKVRSVDGRTSFVAERTIGAEYIERLEHPESDFWVRYVWTPRGGYT
jgi:hypothetical protein